jgi:hypothetical protein
VKRKPGEWSVAEWCVRWLVFSALFIVSVPFEVAAHAFGFVAVAADAFHTVLTAIVDWLARKMKRAVGLKGE